MDTQGNADGRRTRSEQQNKREQNTIAIKPAEDEHYCELLRLMKDEAEEYLEQSLHILGIDWHEFSRLFRTAGSIGIIYCNGRIAGFCWTERRKRVLHIHGLVLGRSFQGRGLGARILEHIERRFKSDTDIIELGVHRSNERAISLYRKHGYTIVSELPEMGFYIMQKRLLS